MFFKDFCILVFWTKIASALEGLMAYWTGLCSCIQIMVSLASISGYWRVKINATGLNANSKCKGSACVNTTILLSLENSCNFVLRNACFNITI